VDDLLLLARVDDHRLAIHPTSVSADAILQQAADRARRQVPFDKEIAVDVPADAHLFANRERTAQAIDNLLTNALRHATAHVQLSARSNGHFVELHVTDDGPGFSPDFYPARGNASRAPTLPARRTALASDSRSSARSQKRTTVRPTP